MCINIIKNDIFMDETILINKDLFQAIDSTIAVTET